MMSKNSLPYIFGFFMLFPSLMNAQSVKTASTNNKSAVKTANKTTALGRNIEITVKPYKNTKLYLGTNYGQNRVLVDSTILTE